MRRTADACLSGENHCQDAGPVEKSSENSTVFHKTGGKRRGKAGKTLAAGVKNAMVALGKMWKVKDASSFGKVPVM